MAQRLGEIKEKKSHQGCAISNFLISCVLMYNIMLLKMAYLWECGVLDSIK